MGKRKSESDDSNRSPSPKRARCEPSTSSVDSSKKLNVAPFESFGRKFFKTMGQKDGNYVASPLSCQFALGMVLAGAKDNTLTTMAKAMQLPRDVKASAATYRAVAKCLQTVGKEVELKMANKAYINQQLVVKSGYQTLLKDSFEACAEKINFSDNRSVGKVNGWVKKATQGKIAHLIDSLHDDSGLVLLNAIYYKGKWDKSFKAKATKMKCFFSGTKKINVPTMYKMDKLKHAYLKDYASQLLVLPYKGGKINMVLVLPNEKCGLQQLEKKIFDKDLTQLVARATKKTVKVYLPKFKMETTIQLKKCLAQLGLGIIFSDRANLTGITDTDPMKVDGAIQKALIEVNEEGTVAVGATAIFCLRVGPKRHNRRLPVVFRCDHPFLFFITYESKFCLFGGRVNHPKQ